MPEPISASTANGVALALALASTAPWLKRVSALYSKSAVAWIIRRTTGHSRGEKPWGPASWSTMRKLSSSMARPFSVIWWAGFFCALIRSSTVHLPVGPGGEAPPLVKVGEGHAHEGPLPDVGLELLLGQADEVHEEKLQALF